MAPETRVQFAFWLRAELGDRFRRYCERVGRYQRDVAEEAIEFFLNAKCPAAGGPDSAAALSTFTALEREPGFDSRDGRKT